MEKRIAKLSFDPFAIGLADRECSLFIDPQSAQIFLDEGEGEGRVNGAVFTPANGPRFASRSDNGSGLASLILEYCGMELTVGSVESVDRLSSWVVAANALLRSKRTTAVPKPQSNGSTGSMQRKLDTIAE